MIKSSLKSLFVFLVMDCASLVGAQTLQTLVSFNGSNGLDSYAGLTLGNDGNFYGTTSGGGSSGYGTVFKMTTVGTLVTLVSFANTNGQYPNRLTLADDGSFYGTTVYGGNTNLNNGYGCGTVFKVTTNGALTRLISFNNTNGANPETSLALGEDGNYYGTTANGGSNGYGTMFQVTANGTFTKLVDLTNQLSSLTLGNDGNFYGTTASAPNYGIVFKMTTNGNLTPLVSFANTNGQYPSGLTLANDGTFYGTTLAGGITNSARTEGMGTVFRVTTNGILTMLVSFDNTNGENPDTALTLGNDGNFYGMTAYGGITNALYPLGGGTMFQVTPNGTLTTLAVFNGANGVSELGGLTVANDGNLYGTTGYGGNTNLNSGYGYGTVFCWAFSPVIIVQPQSQTNNADATVSFLISSLGYAPMSFQWRRNGTNLVDGGNITGSITNKLSITSISDADAASYSVIVSNSYNSVTSSIANLTVIDRPIITAQPTNLLVLTGGNVAFGVFLSGSASFFRYQWRFNGTNLSNATNAVYAIIAAATNNAGNYSLLVTNAAGSAVSSNAALTVVLSPNSETNYASSTAIFTVTPFGPESLHFQWQVNGSILINADNVSGANTSTLTIVNLSDADEGIYNSIVSDNFSSVTTSNAALAINDSLLIVTQPLSQAVSGGSNVTFTAKAFGAPPFIFQWYYDNSPVGSPTSGTNISSYTLTNVQVNQSGNYRVQVINSQGSLTSSNAQLTVFIRPTMNLQLLAGYPVLDLSGMLSNHFVVEYSTNLAGTNWTALLSLSNLLISPYQFLDPAGVVPPARFYRAVMQ